LNLDSQRKEQLPNTAQLVQLLRHARHLLRRRRVHMLAATVHLLADWCLFSSPRAVSLNTSLVGVALDPNLSRLLGVRRRTELPGGLRMQPSRSLMSPLAEETPWRL
jgi:hypothetical protein